MSESHGVPIVYAQCDKNQKEKYEKRYEKTWNSAGNAVGHLAMAPALRKQSPRPRRKWVLFTRTRVLIRGTLSGANANGGYGYVEYNLSKVFGLVADLGANHVGNAGGVQLRNTTFEYLFGPRFNWRKSRFTPYAQVLVGGQRFSIGLDPSSTTPRLVRPRITSRRPLVVVSISI